MKPATNKEPVWYLTFPVKYKYEPHPSGRDDIDPDGWWEIHGGDYHAARNAVIALLGDKWSWLESEDEFDASLFPHGATHIIEIEPDYE